LLCAFILTMEKILKNQNELNNEIKRNPIIGNIYYDENGDYKPIDFDNENIKITSNSQETVIERINCA